MLRSKNPDEKTYEQYIAEAIARIPLYSNEWTNYNPSDPGITMLENLSAFAALQQSMISEVSDDVKCQLLKLAGFVPETGMPSEIYIHKLDGKKWNRIIVPGEKLYAQDICFEFSGESGMTDTNLVSICRTADGKTEDLSELLEPYGVPQGVEVYGDHPVGGEEIHFYFDELPLENELVFFVKIKERFERNPFRKGDKNPFAEQKWFLRMEDGRKEVSVEDGTWQFLSSGIIRVLLPEDRDKISVNSENGMYELIVRLESCAYDLVPELMEIRGMLSRVAQKETFSAICFYETQKNRLTISHRLLKNGSFELFEEQDQGYRLLGTGEYECQRQDEMTLQISLPSQQENGKLMVLFFDEKVMAYRNLGIVYGYDEQEIDLPPWNRVYRREFSVLVRKGDRYKLVPPEYSLEDGIYYKVNEKDSKLVIFDCGDYEGGELLLGNYCIYGGDNGNVLSGTLLTDRDEGEEHQAVSCINVLQGHYEEELEDLRRRFAKDLRTPATIVTREDCEQIIRSIPGLSIHKVHAITDASKNEIRIVIKPYSKEAYPKLSKVYMLMVKKYLSEKRMLSTRIRICEPKYVPIRVHVSLHMKKNYAKGRNKIEELLNQLLDGGQSGRNFGDTIYFHEIYQAVLGLECVDEILSLTIAPQKAGASLTKGQDIHLAPDALSCPGEYLIETGL